jgi:hypothetical protein
MWWVVLVCRDEYNRWNRKKLVLSIVMVRAFAVCQWLFRLADVGLLLLRSMRVEWVVVVLGGLWWVVVGLLVRLAGC